eukprot:Ihof_evm2s58 gene=Ihof_evmTU2s58
MEVLGLSLITNMVKMDHAAPDANHAEVLEIANMRSKDMQNFVGELIKRCMSEANITGVVIADKTGLCLEARGTASSESSGYISSILSRSKALSPDHTESATVTIEFDT